MNEKTLLEAVVLAGELMLVSGAEIYRVERHHESHAETIGVRTDGNDRIWNGNLCHAERSK